MWGCATHSQGVHSCHKREGTRVWASLASWCVAMEGACLHICVPEETAGPLHDVGLHGSACKYTCGLVCMCVLFKCWAVNAPAVCPGSAKVGVSLGGTGEGLERILSPEQRGEVMGRPWA